MSKRILVVDDSETAIMFEKMMLAGMGLEVATAKNGRLALEAVARQKPDMMLLDLMMPEMDGIETCRQLKGNPETMSIPIVVVTTKGDPDMVEKAFKAGCDDYITKPVDKLELLSKVKSHLG
jgi:CheY-like chemotaxis protein